ncbi:DUF6737 family protein [Cyanothece sp. BG0011]|uniref:DUF6737 family protein n=1 Tax=Cyanothece sp. BG0011 TaxID=2082950 RepID=UPI000D1DA55A|nr:DUF6737 family protein [Cyanothece sp. BG0011]
MTEFSNLESSNIWDYKPKWCQPWSILLTGIILSVGSWFLIHIVWLTSLISILIIVWWVYFLILYPRMFKEYVESQKNS